MATSIKAFEMYLRILFLYGVCGSRNSGEFTHPILALESMGAKRYFRCCSLNIGLMYK